MSYRREKAATARRKVFFPEVVEVFPSSRDGVAEENEVERPLANLSQVVLVSQSHGIGNFTDEPLGRFPCRDARAMLGPHPIAEDGNGDEENRNEESGTVGHGVILQHNLGLARIAILAYRRSNSFVRSECRFRWNFAGSSSAKWTIRK